MDEVEEVAAEFDGFGGGQLGAGAGDVDVAADGGDGGDAAEGVENLGFADVAGVQDVIDPDEGGEDFGAEEAVGVRENA